MVLLLSFLGSGRTVYAYPEYIYLDDGYTAFKDYSYNWSSFIATEYSDSQASSYNTVPTHGYFDVDIKIHDRVYLGSDVSPGYELQGWIKLADEFDCEFVGTSSAPANLTVNEIEYLGMTTDVDNFCLREDQSTWTQYVTTANNHTGKAGKFKRKIYFTFQGLNFYDQWMTIETHLRFRVYIYCFNTTPAQFPAGNLPVQHIFNHLVYDSYGFHLYLIKSDLWYLQQIAQQQSVDNLTIINSINSAKNQAHSDAAVAQSQAADIIDDINYDHSGTSQSVSATQSAYDAAQGAADAAVDAAVHSYASDLSTVEAYDYSTFFTSQRNSAVFWRDVGEYILDSSNLGFVSGSVIIVTLIGLVIFMLRL